MTHLGSNAVEAITERGWVALPYETGGLLLGWYEADGGVWIDRAIEVPARTAGTHHYERTAEAAQAALDAALADEPEGSPIGYVGEWHTHPEPCGPSDVDLETLVALGQDRDSGPLVLVVCAHQPDKSWVVYTLSAPEQEVA